MGWGAVILVLQSVLTCVLFGDIISRPKSIRILFFGFLITLNESQFESIYCYSLIRVPCF